MRQKLLQMKTERHHPQKITNEDIEILYITEVRKLQSLLPTTKRKRKRRNPARNSILADLAELKEVSPMEHAELIVEQFHALDRIEHSTIADHTFDYVHPVDAFLIGYHDHENNARYYEHSYYQNDNDL